MATVELFEGTTFAATADLSAQQYKAVKLSTANVKNTFACEICAGATDKPIGILQNKPLLGQAAEVACRPGDIVRVFTDGNAGAIAIGDYLGTDAAGKLVKKSADHDYVIARALEASTADGTIISAELIGPMTLSV